MASDSDIQVLVCPSCYRIKGEIVILEKEVCRLPTYSTAAYVVKFFRCKCGFAATEDELLVHEYRVKNTRLLQLVHNIRGWAISPFNTNGGKLFIIDRAIRTYYAKNEES